MPYKCLPGVDRPRSRGVFRKHGTGCPITLVSIRGRMCASDRELNVNPPRTCAVGGGFSRIGPEKGIIHLVLTAVNNAVWDMFAKSRKKPLWKLIVDMTPVRCLTRTRF